MERLEVFKIIALQAGRGELSFPANVKATLQLQQALDDPDCHIEAAARMVMAEPLLSARTVALANSAAYNRAGNDIANVRAAVMRLGFRTLKSMVASVIVRQLGNQATDPALRAKSARLWEHTAHVAALSQVLARRVTNVDVETAMFAAIVHEVGGFYLLSRAEEFPGLLDDNTEDWIEYGEKLIGRGVLRQLGVPDQVLQAVEGMWHGGGPFPPRTLGATLLLANDLAPVASPLHPPESARARQAAAMIDFGIGGSTLHTILDDSAEEIESLAAALLV
ncbi:HDOD domain-containing protein [Janthinobacterium agaricidamnosum]|uniref:HDOD domain protein n=1 Tax=Janthinobacterium agaricidamnosum NBRC 102515 = DSM 9628 TaxID=1349767 RepID=W0V7P1_9BURK|nr:HDOD domain-containing protein [Janthinobacterium agaricidamnosum]CDG84849.1 HDOD domain protein [Janthinobacterium agaricidamnosum NBRC 102515 = DSM 9628]